VNGAGGIDPRDAPLAAPDITVPDLLAHGEARFPGRDCVRVGATARTYREASARASLLAGHLSEAGLGDGRRIAVLAHNELELVEIRAGVQRAGAILVPLNHRLSSGELTLMMEDCDPDLLIVGRGLWEASADIDPGARLQLGDSPADAAGGFDRVLADASPAGPPRMLPGAATSVISYTSGTTGRAKGVMLSNWATHATMIAMGQAMAAGPDGVYLCSNPMFHVGVAIAYAFVYLGGTSIQLERFTPTDFLEQLEAATFTHAQLVPTMVGDVLDLAPPGTMGRLRRLLYGAAPMPPELARRAIDDWGCELVNGYGSTEAMGISMLDPEEHDPENAPHLLASVGRSWAGMASRVVDEDDEDVGPGVVGEVLARGPNVMSGYWGNPEASAEALRGGWMHTGDLGYRDADGYLFLVDRRSDKIITGGENVYPSEVEWVLAEHPAVAEAAVIGVPHPRWGEAVCAVIVTAPGRQVDDDELLRFARGRLSGYKVPKELRRRDDLPRNPTGKLLRRDLRRWWGEPA
jgi:long-chain acyl-CoA synthetase